VKESAAAKNKWEIIEAKTNVLKNSPLLVETLVFLYKLIPPMNRHKHRNVEKSIFISIGYKRVYSTTVPLGTWPIGTTC